MKTSLRENIQTDVFDYLQLTHALAGYTDIRGKIGRLIDSGEVIRIKKGFYTFPDYLRRGPILPCVVANMLYGPSYVSCDYALSYYGMIPERVELVTSMTTGRPRQFSTPVGNFIYYQRRSADYSVGVECLDSNGSGLLIASREKAIYDKGLIDKRFTGKGVREYLLNDLRIDEESISGLNRTVLDSLRKTSRGKMTLLIEFLLERQK